jgi:1,2-diacylglycerol 3-alpha-glucosyltransferase
MNLGIVTVWGDCGAGMVSAQYAKALTGQGAQVSIYARGAYMTQLNDAGMPSEFDVCYDDSPYPTRVNQSRFRRWITSRNIQLILFNEQRSWAAVSLALNAGVRTLCYVDYYKQDTLPLFELYDCIICNTRRHHGVFKSLDALYVPWGTDIKRFKYLNKAQSSNHLTFLHSAGLGGPNDRKGTALAIEAFRRSVSKGRLLIHTQLAPENLPQRWQELSAGDQRIQFNHEKLPPEKVYALGDVYIYPSRLEGIGLSVPEALSSGLPCIVPDSAPMNEFVDETCGILCNIAARVARQDGYYWPEEIADLNLTTAAINRYSADRQLFEAHRLGARTRAEKYLYWEENSRDLLRKIETALALRSPAPDSRRKLVALGQKFDAISEPTPSDHFRRFISSTLARARRS